MSDTTDKNVPKQFIKVTPQKNNDGSFGVRVELEPEFEDWFIKSQGLKQWDEGVFTVWFKKFFDDAIKDGVHQDASRSEQQNIDIWDNGGSSE